ncbi:MAG: hypothetical protein RLO81_00965 [Fulvivirga sp.]|uniref:DUF4961 domain-containing protein n=1 Tax=Fulvivirga sp. TaxID=1931237 RepID=UPI0032EC886B
MKRTLFILLISFLSLDSIGQLVKTSPAVFTAEDEVTFTIDATASSDDRLVGYTQDVWAWVFISDGCSANCDAPTNINPAGGEETEAAKMTRSEDNPDVYSITFVPTEFLGKDPGEIREIGFVLKSRDWGDGIQTQDFTVTVTPIEFVPSENRTFPSKFTQEDVVTLFLDKSFLTDDSSIKNLEDIYVYLFYDVVRAGGAFESDVAFVAWPEVGNTPSLNMTDRGDEVFSLTFIPNELLGLNQGDEITSIKYIFRSADGSQQSATYEAFPLSLN